MNKVDNSQSLPMRSANQGVIGIGGLCLAAGLLWVTIASIAAHHFSAMGLSLAIPGAVAVGGGIIHHTILVEDHRRKVVEDHRRKVVEDHRRKVEMERKPFYDELEKTACLFDIRVDQYQLHFQKIKNRNARSDYKSLCESVYKIRSLRNMTGPLDELRRKKESIQQEANVFWKQMKEGMLDDFAAHYRNEAATLKHERLQDLKKQLEKIAKMLEERKAIELREDKPEFEILFSERCEALFNQGAEVLGKIEIEKEKIAKAEKREALKVLEEQRKQSIREFCEILQVKIREFHQSALEVDCTVWENPNCVAFREKNKELSEASQALFRNGVLFRGRPTLNERWEDGILPQIATINRILSELDELHRKLPTAHLMAERWMDASTAIREGISKIDQLRSASPEARAAAAAAGAVVVKFERMASSPARFAKAAADGSMEREFDHVREKLLRAKTSPMRQDGTD